MCGCQSLEGLVRYFESVTTHFIRGQPARERRRATAKSECEEHSSLPPRLKHNTEHAVPRSAKPDSKKNLLTFKLHYFPGGCFGQTLQTDLAGQSQTNTAAAQQEAHLTDTCVLKKTPTQTHLSLLYFYKKKSNIYV